MSDQINNDDTDIIDLGPDPRMRSRYKWWLAIEKCKQLLTTFHMNLTIEGKLKRFMVSLLFIFSQDKRYGNRHKEKY